MPVDPRMSGPELMLQVDGIRVCRGDRVLIDGLGFRLHAGELLHLTGANGSGKSSLLEAVAGLRPAEGAPDRDSLPGLHWVGHRLGLSSQLSLQENLLEAAAMLGAADEDRVTEALRRFGLARRRHRRLREVSAGQARRTALARLLLCHRPLWLLDEPYASLDADGARLLDAVIHEHLQAGGAVLLSSHQALDPSLGAVRTLALTS